MLQVPNITSAISKCVTFSPFVSLVISSLVPLSNFIVSGAQNNILF